MSVDALDDNNDKNDFVSLQCLEWGRLLTLSNRTNENEILRSETAITLQITKNPTSAITMILDNEDCVRLGMFLLKRANKSLLTDKEEKELKELRQRKEKLDLYKVSEGTLETMLNRLNTLSNEKVQVVMDLVEQKRKVEELQGRLEAIFDLAGGQ